MKALSIQVQPNRSPEIDMERIQSEFEKLAMVTELVAHHDFNHGEDNGPYYNFTFGTTSAAKLWQRIQQSIYHNVEFGAYMQASSMAMCSSEHGWDDYLLLFHYDPSVTLDDATAL